MTHYSEPHSCEVGLGVRPAWFCTLLGDDVNEIIMDRHRLGATYIICNPMVPLTVPLTPGARRYICWSTVKPQSAGYLKCASMFMTYGEIAKFLRFGRNPMVRLAVPLTLGVRRSVCQSTVKLQSSGYLKCASPLMTCGERPKILPLVGPGQDSARIAPVPEAAGARKTIIFCYCFQSTKAIFIQS